MAKRRSPKSPASDNNATTPAQPKTRRSRATSAPEDTIGAYPGVERSEEDGMIAQGLTGGQSSASEPLGVEPSDDDIRRRAYERYLERGANHGMDFEDWLVAERELRGSKV
jgi:hypothetical protein